MSNSILEGLIKEKDYSFKKHLFKVVKNYNLDVFELLLLVYFINQDKLEFDINNIKKNTYMEDKEVMGAFSSLNTKGLITVSIAKKEDGKISELIDMSNVYKAMVSDLNLALKEKTTENIFNIFESEFGRTLSPIEFEIINAWLKAGISEELITGALKEATFNGVSNLRYIDKIIYEWGKKGFKTMEDVNNHLKRKELEETKVLFDYNWLDDAE